MECPICYIIITNSCIGSCTHHFCKLCLINWCKYGGTKCPICKTFISEIKDDIEFDTINSINNLNLNNIIDNSNLDNSNLDNSNTINPINKKIIVEFKENDKAGVTLKNNYIKNIRAPGVRISKIDEKKKCYKNGLRKNDKILTINNIPCINHKQSVDIINFCMLSGKQILCTLL